MSFEPLKSHTMTSTSGIEIRTLTGFAEMAAEATRCPLEEERKKSGYQSKTIKELPVMSFQTVDPFAPLVELKMVPVSAPDPE